MAALGNPFGQFLEMWYTFRWQHFQQPLFLLSCSCSASVRAAKCWMVPAIAAVVAGLGFAVKLAGLEVLFESLFA